MNVAEAPSAIFEPLADGHSQIATLTHDYPARHVVPLHFHDRDQLVYASQGVMTVRTSDGAWVVPTHRAVWIPATVPHTITMSRHGSDANSLPRAAAREGSAARLLRSKRVAAIEGTDSACVHLHQTEEKY
jgi:hypothetical protein